MITIPPSVIAALAAAAIGAGTVGGLAWYVRGAQVERLKADLDRASDGIATRDKALAELQIAQRSLIDSIARQNGSIETLADAGKRNAENAARLLERVRAGNHAIAESIEALTARIKAPAASAMTCRQALEELRAELLK